MSDPRLIENAGGHIWKMIKADIVYNQIVFISLYSIIVPTVILNAVWGGLEEHISRLMLVSVGFLGIVVGTEEIKTMRIRLTVLLPISVRQNGMLRFPVFSLYWASLIVFLWISSLISRRGDLNLSYLWFILVKTALILILVSCMGIGQDVSSCFVRRVPGAIFRVLAKVCAIGAAFLYFFSTPYEDWPPAVTEYLANIFISAPGALALLALGFALAALSVFIFARRKAFTE